VLAARTLASDLILPLDRVEVDLVGATLRCTAWPEQGRWARVGVAVPDRAGAGVTGDDEGRGHATYGMAG
jgi:hypothetical protein